MNAEENLFYELADLPDTDRRLYYERHAVPPQVRAGVESLIAQDRESKSSLADPVRAAAQRAVADFDPSAAPTHCGTYELKKLLGSGGMGAVYLAERIDGEIQQIAAIKLLRSDSSRPGWHERFLMERQLLAKLHHASIVHVIDAGHTDAGRPYLVMEYVDGVAIDAYCADLDVRDCLKLFLRVCDGVRHAHRHLIIHRDIKPSNILVDGSGQPKLVDFGIAKLLDDAADPTQTVERLLTLNYASPEQLRGETQTTATDVYSLGAVLYKLITGRSPHESETSTSALAVITGTHRITPPSRLNRALPGDIDSIVQKALRAEPEERYASVDAFAADIQALLDSRPVQARSGNAWYRSRKFVRRYRMLVAGAALVIASLSAGLYVASSQRAIAQRRFVQVRQLANKVLALDATLRGMPGSTKVRHQVVAMSKEYLEALAAETRSDPDLALELGKAYDVLARAQGVPGTTNLGQQQQAVESLEKADALVDFALAANPRNPQALLQSGLIANDRMIMADVQHRREDAFSQGNKAAQRFLQFLNLNPPASEQMPAARSLQNIAIMYKNAHRFDEAIHYARLSLQYCRKLPYAGMNIGSGLSVIADSMRFSGNLDGALETAREAERSIQTADFPSDAARRITVFSVLWREGLILGEDGAISLNQPAEAIAVLQRTFDLVEEWARQDPNDANSRGLFESAGRELGKLLSYRDPPRALAVYDLSLRRLHEAGSNPKVRRAEAEIWAASSYPLRRLHRVAEAQDRIGKAIQILRETNDYPSDRVSPGEVTDHVLRAQADHYLETGQPQMAEVAYQELLGKIMTSKPEPHSDLRHAMDLSTLYRSLAAVHRRNSHSAEAQAASSLRLELWKQWDKRLPNNKFVRQQLDAAERDLES